MDEDARPGMIGELLLFLSAPSSVTTSIPDLKFPSCRPNRPGPEQQREKLGKSGSKKGMNFVFLFSFLLLVGTLWRDAESLERGSGCGRAYWIWGLCFFNVDS